jgi:hypothetical protein
MFYVFVSIISVVENYKFNIKWKSNNLRKKYSIKVLKQKIIRTKSPVYKKYTKHLGGNESIQNKQYITGKA